ncbi:UNVERIFIED_CONTAM: hypothetical protein HDU68_012748 [Siphonaria sp. JEL0065]|nr:hypothetical protein HDU68_012748 [Siphonaria sp. JEL0065]
MPVSTAPNPVSLTPNASAVSSPFSQLKALFSGKQQQQGEPLKPVATKPIPIIAKRSSSFSELRAAWSSKVVEMKPEAPKVLHFGAMNLVGKRKRERRPSALATQRVITASPPMESIDTRNSVDLDQWSDETAKLKEKRDSGVFDLDHVLYNQPQPVRSTASLVSKSEQQFIVVHNSAAPAEAPVKLSESEILALTKAFSLLLHPPPNNVPNKRHSRQYIKKQFSLHSGLLPGEDVTQFLQLLQRTMKEPIFITNASEIRILGTVGNKEGVQQDGFWNELNMPRAAADMDLDENELGLESKEEVSEQLRSLNALLQAQPVRSGSPLSLFDYDSNYFLHAISRRKLTQIRRPLSQHVHISNLLVRLQFFNGSSTSTTFELF